MTHRIMIAHVRLSDCSGDGCRLVIRDGDVSGWEKCKPGAHSGWSAWAFWAKAQILAIMHAKEARATCYDPRCRMIARDADESKQSKLF